MIRLSPRPIQSLCRAFHSSSYCNKKVIKPFYLADIGEGIAECEVVKWFVKPPKTLEQFDPICEVQSDKASVEITSPYEGSIVRVFHEQGDMVKVGSKLCEFEVEEEGEVVVVEAQLKMSDKPQSLQADLGDLDRSAHVFATPAVRRLAREHKVDLKTISGTGKGGRIMKEDVLNAISGPTLEDKEFEYPSIATPMTTVNNNISIPLSTVRRAMFKAMSSSLSIPHFTYSDEIDVTELERVRLKLNNAIPPKFKKVLTKKDKHPFDRVPEDSRLDRITLLPLFIKALSFALQDHPLFRSKLVVPDGQLEKATLFESPTGLISLALSSPLGGGLFTPSIPNTDKSSVYEIASTLTHLQTLALQSPTPKFPELFRRPGTITLSNIGSVGGTYTHPVIPPGGQLAIGALGKVRVLPRYIGKEEQVARKEAIEVYEAAEEASWEPRLIMNVSFSGDHRVVEGMELALLVRDWKAIIEHPEKMIGLGR